MKVCAILNNYQMGSYAKKVLEQSIVKEERIDSCHTRVVWELSKSDASLLQRVLGNKKLIILED